MAIRHALFAFCLVGSEVLACRTRPLALGEALVVVQTDVAIPRYVNRLRVDVLREDGTTLETRDIIAARPEDWPISFSVTADEEAMRGATVRLRAYAEGHAVTRAEALTDGGGIPAIVAQSIEEACAEAPTLVLGTPLTLRRGAQPITQILPYAPPTDAGDAGAADCTLATRAGSAVAKVVITEKARYHFEIQKAVPNGARSEPGGDTTLAIRLDCPFPTSQIACNDDIAEDAGNFLSALDLTLDAGTYWLVTGGVQAAFADLTLLALREGQTPIAPTPAPAIENPGVLEPGAGTTIDRLVRVALIQGYRGTVPVVLSGECFGTPADMGQVRSCVDRAGELVASAPAVADGDLERSLPAPPPWSGSVAAPCVGTPKPSSTALDVEICMPGGAFILGDRFALTDLDSKDRPERMRVVDPFFIDKFELTVARYRAAVKAGFVVRDGDPTANKDAFSDAPGGTCTYSEVPRERESLPLNCVSYDTARALCNFLGGDLPTEDQWEYAATAAGRPRETEYPWGSDPLPDCSRVVAERSKTTAVRCAPDFGPVAVDDPKYANPVTGDVSMLGVVGLAGNIREWTSTGFYTYDDAVWVTAGLRGALNRNANDTAPLRSVRGGDWAGYGLLAVGSLRQASAATGHFDSHGLRCVRPGR